MSLALAPILDAPVLRISTSRKMCIRDSFTHTNFGKAALEQLDTFESLGVNPRRVAIGHVGGLIDPEVRVHKEICKRGAFVGFDRQGGPGDARQIPMVMALIEADVYKRQVENCDCCSVRGVRVRANLTLRVGRRLHL